MKFLGINLRECEIGFSAIQGKYFSQDVQEFLNSKIHSFQNGQLTKIGHGVNDLQIRSKNRTTGELRSQHYTNIRKSMSKQILSKILPSVFHYISIKDISAKDVTTQFFSYIAGKSKEGKGVTPVVFIDLLFRLCDNEFI